MVAAQHMVQTILGTDNSTKDKKVETTRHHKKQPQLSVRVSMIEYLNEEMEITFISIPALPVIRQGWKTTIMDNCSEWRSGDVCACVHTHAWYDMNAISSVIPWIPRQSQ